MSSSSISNNSSPNWVPVSSHTDPVSTSGSQSSSSNSNSNSNNDSIQVRTSKISKTTLSQATISTDSAKKPVATSRKILDYSKNSAASLQTKGKYTPEHIRDHANLRVQIMHSIFEFFHKLGLRSDGTEYQGIEVKIGRARYQVGKGSKKNNTHAAHANPAAGLSDNLREAIKKQIIDSRNVTPKKELILKAKGFTDGIMNALHKALNDKSIDPKSIETIITDIFDKIWKEVSIIDGTPFILQMNATTELPGLLNLGCDKSLETVIRPQIEKLVLKIILGRIDPEQATRRLHNMMIDHFDSTILSIQHRLGLLNDYVENLTDLNFLGNTYSEDSLKGLLQEMQAYQSKMLEKQPGISKTNLKDNRNFLTESLKKLEDSPKSAVGSILKTFFENYDILKSEAFKKITILKKLLEYNILEKEGTILPPFELDTPSPLKRKRQLDLMRNETESPKKKQKIESEIQEEKYNPKKRLLFPDQ